MRIRVLGCHGSSDLIPQGAEWLRCSTCGFLIDDTFLLDAGTIGAKLPHDKQKLIRHVLLSHLHLDHIKGLPTFADNMVEESCSPVTIASIPEVLSGLREHVFNDKVYPNFVALPDSRNPILKPQVISFRKPSTVGDFEVLPVAVNHLVPTAGFIIQNGSSGILYSADTYSTYELWEAARQCRSLKAALIEVSLPKSMAELVKASKHLTPSLFADEYRKLGRPDLPVYAYHMKPRFREQIVAELHLLGIPNLHVLNEDQEFTI